ncbi:ABC transporter permease [Bacillus sp. FSL W7-1360]
MTVNELIIQNFKKNLKNYYLYVFTLMFSVALYFSFVTLQYDPAMESLQEGAKGSAGMKAASVLLIVIVATFLMYANNIFIKRRSKEIGLFQLIGMTKGKVFRILSAENCILYFGSLAIGVFLGFAISKLMMMILFKVTAIDAVATLSFSFPALIQTIFVFSFIYVLILFVNYLFVKRQTILSLFRVISSSEARVKRVSWIEIIIGILGIISILVGYAVSSIMFDDTLMELLFPVMLFILGSVITGTYLFYKGSVTFLFNLVRKKKNGHLGIQDVMSLSSIMFRMKSNALMLTIITTISGLAIGLLSLSYISYYSAEKDAQKFVPNDFSFVDVADADQFKETLNAHAIGYDDVNYDIVRLEVNVADILDGSAPSLGDVSDTQFLSVVSDAVIDDMDIGAEEAILTGYDDMVQLALPLQDKGSIKLHGKEETFALNYTGLRKEYIISAYFTRNSPTVIVDDTIFEKLMHDIDPELQSESSTYVGIDIKDEKQLEEATVLLHEMPFMSESDADTYPPDVQVEVEKMRKQSSGLILFVVGFLGLTFLMTSGCILYFKQMDESEDEKGSYTILRKLGFTQGDLLKGIKVKQAFCFGIPLLLGLSHSYFAVKSGWFLFGTELWTPMIVVMGIYATLYSIFAILAVMYCKKVIKEAL